MWMVLNLPGKTAEDAFLQCSLPTFLSFLSLQSLRSPLEIATGPSNCSACSWVDSHSPLPTVTSSVRQVVLAYCWTLDCFLCYHCLCCCGQHCHFPHSTTSSMVRFWAHRRMDLLDVLVCCAEMHSDRCLISCISKGREKRNNSQGHDTDVSTWLFQRKAQSSACEEMHLQWLTNVY